MLIMDGTAWFPKTVAFIRDYGCTWEKGEVGDRKNTKQALLLTTGTSLAQVTANNCQNKNY